MYVLRSTKRAPRVTPDCNPLLGIWRDMARIHLNHGRSSRAQAQPDGNIFMHRLRIKQSTKEIKQVCPRSKQTPIDTSRRPPNLIIVV